jgi:N-glycosylase/DNA lyase
MTQIAAILTRNGAIQLELPDAGCELMQGVHWGYVDAFPTPAYWAYQVLARRLVGQPAQYRLGRTLAEEVGACLLGGHGIPAPVGLAAYERLRDLGAFGKTPPKEEQLASWLREPLQFGSRSIRYRFAAQKAHYLAMALPLLADAPTFTEGRALRDWLLRLSGVGPKTASWVARNWLGADDVAILDIHIMRVGQAMGLFPRELTVERHYLPLEGLFLEFSNRLDVRASELDAVVWLEMASSPQTVRHLVNHLNSRAAHPHPHTNRRGRTMHTDLLAANQS